MKAGCCWRVGNGHSIQILGDKWIPNYPTNAPLNLVEDEVREATVAELIDQDLHAWRADFIMDMFEKKMQKLFVEYSSAEDRWRTV